MNEQTIFQVVNRPMLPLCMESIVFHHMEHLLLLHFVRQILRLILKKYPAFKLMRYIHYTKSHFHQNYTYNKSSLRP